MPDTALPHQPSLVTGVVPGDLLFANLQWLLVLCGFVLLAPQQPTTVLFAQEALNPVSEPLARVDAEAPRSEVNRPLKSEKNLVYRVVEGEEVKADVFRPDDKEMYPVVMMIHGGAWSAGDKWELQDHARELAQSGFVVASINYRLAPRVKIDAQVDDCREAMKWVTQKASEWNGDARRFGLWGYSAGAHLAALLALSPDTDDPPILAVAVGGTPCDFSFIADKNPLMKMVMGGNRSEMPEIYKKYAPLEYANEAAPPFFFFHGDADILVPASNSRQLYDRLLKLDVQAEYCIVEGKGHLLTFLDAKVRRKAIRFLQSQLKDDR